jgi:hypothetical protein
MKTATIIALLTGGLWGWLFGADHFFDSSPDGLRLYHTTGTAAIIEDFWLSLYTPVAVAAALSAGSRYPFFAGHSLAHFGFAILQVFPLLLLASSRLRHHLRYRRLLDRYCLCCAALIVVGFLYIHFPMRHSMNKGLASTDGGKASLMNHQRNGHGYHCAKPQG